MIAVTGWLYLFRDEIESFWYRDFLFVTQGSPQVRPAEQWLPRRSLPTGLGDPLHAGSGPGPQRRGGRRANARVLAVYVDPHTQAFSAAFATTAG